VVLFLLVTQTVTLPVGFIFYRPDPVLAAWGKKDKRYFINSQTKSTALVLKNQRTPNRILIDC
jgi:hypothetical protein